MGGGHYNGGGSYAGTIYGLNNAEEYGYAPLNNFTEEKEPPKVFISYHTRDVAQARFLGHQLEDEHMGVGFEDNSPKKRYRGDWTVPMTAKIGDSDAVIVLVGEETHEREAVKWEIETAKKLGKPVYAVRIHADQMHSVPQEVYNCGGQVLPWKLEVIKQNITVNT